MLRILARAIRGNTHLVSIRLDSGPAPTGPLGPGGLLFAPGGVPVTGRPTLMCDCHWETPAGVSMLHDAVAESLVIEFKLGMVNTARAPVLKCAP